MKMLVYHVLALLAGLLVAGAVIAGLHFWQHFELGTPPMIVLAVACIVLVYSGWMRLYRAPWISD